MSQPTPQDLANARLRADISARLRRDYEEALALTEQAIGSGWTPTGRYSLVTHDEAKRCRRDGGKPVAAAVCYTAARGDERACFSLVDGVPVRALDYAEAFGPMLFEPDPERTFKDAAGNTCHPHRFQLHWSGYEPNYRPRSPESLAKARRSREAKAVEREANTSPLFAEIIRAEGVVPKRRTR